MSEKARRRLFDALALVNISGLLVSGITRFDAQNAGFTVYLVALAGLYVGAWLALRRYDYPVWAMLMLQAAVLGHLAGWLVVVDGRTLYTTSVSGMPMDKVIHAFNSAAAAAFVTVLFRRAGLQLGGWEGFVVVMVVCGLAAMIEVIEYVGTLVLTSTSVGDYANNAQDLIANLAGALVGWALTHLGLARRQPAPAPPSA